MLLLSRSSSVVRERHYASACLFCARAEPAAWQFWDMRENPSVPAGCVVRCRRGPSDGAHEPARLPATDDAVPQQSPEKEEQRPGARADFPTGCSADRQGHPCSDGSVKGRIREHRGAIAWIGYSPPRDRFGIEVTEHKDALRFQSVATPQSIAEEGIQHDVIARWHRMRCSARSTRDEVKSRSNRIAQGRKRWSTRVA